MSRKPKPELCGIQRYAELHFSWPIQTTKYGHRQSLDGDPSWLISLHAHQLDAAILHFLPNDQETFSQKKIDRCNHRQNYRWLRWRALKIYLITSEEGLTKVQFRKSTNDRAKP
jgi:hypothetical protein